MVSTKSTNSIQPRRQRKHRYDAPLHLKQKFMHVHLSPELRKKYSFRNIQLKKGDKVKILRGQFKKKEGKVDRINLKQERVFIIGMEKVKKEGSKLLVPFHPSNLMITELTLDDKKRKAKLESKGIKKTDKKDENKTTIKKETTDTIKEDKNIKPKKEDNNQEQSSEDKK